jgi:uncharacterized protein with PIN domain
MVTPAEIGTGRAAFNWIKNWAGKVFQYGKRVATLEERVATLEQVLKTMPPDACPYCGERAMRLKEQSGVLGNQGTQWIEEDWRCEKCGKIYRKGIPLKTR